MPPKKTKPKAHQLAQIEAEGLIFKDLRKGQWKVGRQIGQGGFGKIYLASEWSSENPSVNWAHVVKVEPSGNGPLFCEMHYYMNAAKPALLKHWMSDRHMKSLGVPSYVASGNHTGSSNNEYRFLVMHCFGTDLQKCFEQNGKRFSDGTVLRLGLQIVDALEYIHGQGYVHADVKAANLLLGLGSQSEQVYLVDYGLCFRYAAAAKVGFKADPRAAHNGTIELTSRDAHAGAKPSMRGDMEILAYCLLQWLAGELPWEDNLQNCNYVMEQKNRYLKNEDSVKELFRDCGVSSSQHSGIFKFFAYVIKLDYSDTPNYAKLKDFLTKELTSFGLKVSGKLDIAAPNKTGARSSRSASPARKAPAKSRVAATSPASRGKKAGKVTSRQSRDQASSEASSSQSLRTARSQATTACESSSQDTMTMHTAKTALSRSSYHADSGDSSSATSSDHWAKIPVVVASTAADASGIALRATEVIRNRGKDSSLTRSPARKKPVTSKSLPAASSRGRGSTAVDKKKLTSTSTQTSPHLKGLKSRRKAAGK